jgi:hypothetical protein
MQSSSPFLANPGRVQDSGRQNRRRASHDSKEKKTQAPAYARTKGAKGGLEGAATQQKTESKAGAVDDSVKDQGQLYAVGGRCNRPEQELADLRGEVMASSGGTIADGRTGISNRILQEDADAIPRSTNGKWNQRQYVVDDVLVVNEALKKSMVPAEATGQRGNAAHAYQLVPETWSRMRPTRELPSPVLETEAETNSSGAGGHKGVVFCQIRPTTP